MADIKYTMPPPTEDVEQMCLFRWADAQSGKYPELSLMYHIPNGGKRGKAEAGRFRAMGVKSGVPDIFLPVGVQKIDSVDRGQYTIADAFLDNNNSTGVAGTDVKADAVQLEPHDYVPNALQSQNNITRLYSFFNTNEKIVKSSFSENEWISYYEAQVEPDLLQIAAEHTRKLWNRRQRAFGNKLYLESSNLQYASMSTKLSLESMVDRGAMLPNEWRAVFGLAPVAGGDEPIRRLDTAPVKQTKSGGETE